jgi:hypothetical protein
MFKPKRLITLPSRFMLLTIAAVILMMGLVTAVPTAGRATR